jgi:putative SOS response-associated peptidase YedK
MCGRYSLTSPTEAMLRLFGFTGPLPNWPARYNIAPTQLVPAVRPLRRKDKSEARDAAPAAERELVQLRWGLVPSWAKDLSIGAKLINARAEGLAERPAFRAALAARRCLVPADGFYEWQAGPRGKRPYRIGLVGGRPEAMPLFAFAGLWERWAKAPDGVPVESCTIVTTEANRLLRPIYERMPAILAPHNYAAWLDLETPVPVALGLLRPYPAEEMTFYPISARVNNVRYDDAACIAPEAEQGQLI